MAEKALSPAKTAIQTAARYKKQAIKARDEKAKTGARIMGTAFNIGAGAGAGWFAATYPGKWVNVDKELFLGGGLMVLGLTGLAGEGMSDAALEMGKGVLAYWAGSMVKTKVQAG